ncbi:PREDICTED: LOB domain-containing protein 38-like [Lupinus angustifolius]|uniref:LOB domain-containing protein 38-like n=1 Tax=Lupinus angustifolius TaxID=3871 RepID=UPI00092E93AF|nr:PREDICTED: LOB domain-containing protein 38-like [Lupinus angustifolius]
MSCNGCRVLRKGCSESCILRPCLQWIDTPEAQGHATIFIAKFFGRACLMSFISNVPEIQRPALFQSLLFEACGRTVNPVNGAVGLLWTGNWHVCKAAVETVLRGGTLSPMPEFLAIDAPTPTSDDASEGEVTCNDMWRLRDPNSNFRFTSSSSKVSSSGKRKRSEEIDDLNLRLTPSFLQNSQAYICRRDIRRPGSPSMNSEESVTTTACLDSGLGDRYAHGDDRKVLNLFGIHELKICDEKERQEKNISNGGGTFIRGNTELLTPKTLESHPSLHSLKLCHS